MGGLMLPDRVTQPRTQKTQNTKKHSAGAGLSVCDLCSVLCDRPDMDGGRGRPEESLPPVLVAPSHTELFIRALCSVVLRIGAGLRGGVGHTCVLHNSAVIREEDADPGKRGRLGLWPEGRSHAVRRRKPVSMRLQAGQSVRWIRTDRDLRFSNPSIHPQGLALFLGVSCMAAFLVAIPCSLSAGKGSR